MFKRKKKPKLTLADMSSRIRGFILDSQINDAHELSVILGCSTLSDEVQHKEEKESDKRVERIAYLIPLLYSHSHLIAEGSVEFQRINTEEELKGLPDEIWLESKKMMEQISISALIGSISQLIDMGLLEIPKEHKK
jgi:hypothetical protein